MSGMDGGSREKGAGAAGEGLEADRGAQAPARPPFLRRLLRSRTVRAAVAAGTAGALLGAGTVAWRTDSLPVLSHAAVPCWDSFDDVTMEQLFGGRETRVEEQALENDPLDLGLSYGQCRITGYDDGEAAQQLTVRVHALDGLRGSDARQWPEEFLTADMVGMGAGLPGMTSASRAWLALPESCTGPAGDTRAPTVVDVGTGRAGFDSGHQGEDRAALTRAVVAAANGVLRDMGCSGAYRVPDRLPELTDRKAATAQSFCGVKGLTLPTVYREDLTWTRVSGGSAETARVCDAGYKTLGVAVRMTTVVDPALSVMFSRDLLRGGTHIRGTKGYGTVNETRAVYAAACQTGRVIFLIEQKDRPSDGVFDLTRTLLPAYVAAEAERIGCGPEKVTVTTPVRQ
ncbi:MULTISPECIES: hypothetical protein [Streptomyces]|uniref:Uncharacterized protein n=2 Tax=Streptomyces TaxID=1883 RepID=A0A100Y7E9_9ACTN|nr:MULTISPECIES: hypothetical protein [Streptomyces]KUH39064.1 hypothetical protein ATE80_09385 [Streptomyces kanasensis]UUS34584.1 hypothetical protein NRO40_29695 [Streptomyces changanensis]